MDAKTNEEKVKEYFEKNGRHDNKPAKVIKVNFPYKINKYIENLRKFEDVNENLRKIETKNNRISEENQPQESSQKSDDSEDKSFFSRCRKKLTADEIKAELENIKKHLKPAAVLKKDKLFIILIFKYLMVTIQSIKLEYHRRALALLFSLMSIAVAFR